MFSYERKLEKFTNSSLDIYYTNQKKTKASECNECAGICDDKEPVDNKNELYIQYPEIHFVVYDTSDNETKKIVISKKS